MHRFLEGKQRPALFGAGPLSPSLGNTGSYWGRGPLARPHTAGQMFLNLGNSWAGFRDGRRGRELTTQQILGPEEISLGQVCPVDRRGLRNPETATERPPTADTMPGVAGQGWSLCPPGPLRLGGPRKVPDSEMDLAGTTLTLGSRKGA